MLLKVDATQLEWRVKVFLAQDKVALEEINKGFDLHTDNYKRFNLPNRTVAKNYIYRMIFSDAFGDQGFRGPAYAYANDADFMETSTSVKFWEDVVTRTFEKYQGVYNHSVSLISQAVETGRICNPTGRFYLFTPKRGWQGNVDWPRTEILNYPVQGFAADLMVIARSLAYQRLYTKNSKCLFINTVHDDIQLDLDNDPKLCYNVCKTLEKCFADIPETFKKWYGTELNVPMAGEIKMGWSMYEKEMVKFNDKTFEEDWRKLNG